MALKSERGAVRSTHRITELTLKNNRGAVRSTHRTFKNNKILVFYIVFKEDEDEEKQESCNTSFVVENGSPVGFC